MEMGGCASGLFFCAGARSWFHAHSGLVHFLFRIVLAHCRVFRPVWASAYSFLICDQFLLCFSPCRTRLFSLDKQRKATRPKRAKNTAVRQHKIEP